MKTKITTMIMAFAVMSMMILAGCAQSAQQPAAETVVKTAEQAVNLKAAPSFSVETIEGRVVDSEQYKAENKPMILYFMASTCTTCAKNWKSMNEVYPDYKGQVDIVAVSVDPTDDREVLQKLAEDRGFTFETVEGNPELALAYDVKKQTAKFAIDKDGNIVSRHDGALTAQEWRDLIESVL